MKTTIASLLGKAVVILLLAGMTATAAETKKVLVVTTTLGFRHSSIPTAEKVLQKLATKSQVFTVDYARVSPDDPQFQDAATKKPDPKKITEAITKVLAEKMSAEALKGLDAIIFANTTGDLPLPDKEAFLAWLKSGKAFIGMHSCSDTFHGWPAFIQMLGGEFETHREQAGIECMNAAPTHPANAKMAKSWVINQEEVYLIKNFAKDECHDVLFLDKHPNDKTPGHFPISWTKSYGEGRVFYTSLGHREDIWDDETAPNFQRINPVEVSRAYQRHILGGIQWAMKLQEEAPKP